MTHRLTRARDRAGLSLGQAAKLLDLTRGELEDMEAEPTLLADDAARFAEVYGVNVEWLMGEGHCAEPCPVEMCAEWTKAGMCGLAASMPRKAGT